MIELVDHLRFVEWHVATCGSISRILRGTLRHPINAVLNQASRAPSVDAGASDHPRPSTIRPSTIDHRERLWDRRSEIATRPFTIFFQKNWKRVLESEVIGSCLSLGLASRRLKLQRWMDDGD
jgi:hypothetical protein